MQIPLEIVFHHMDHSDAVEKAVRQHVVKLERLCNEITSCHVFVKAPHMNQQQGNLFEVNVETRVPGTELVVSNNPGKIHAHEDAYVAIRDAFDAMQRQIKKWKTKERGH